MNLCEEVEVYISALQGPNQQVSAALCHQWGRLSGESLREETEGFGVHLVELGCWIHLPLESHGACMFLLCLSTLIGQLKRLIAQITHLTWFPGTELVAEFLRSGQKPAKLQLAKHNSKYHGWKWKMISVWSKLLQPSIWLLLLDSHDTAGDTSTLQLDTHTDTHSAILISWELVSGLCRYSVTRFTLSYGICKGAVSLVGTLKCLFYSFITMLWTDAQLARCIFFCYMLQMCPVSHRDGLFGLKTDPYVFEWHLWLKI